MACETWLTLLCRGRYRREPNIVNPLRAPDPGAAAQIRLVLLEQAA
jgi:hypothetical protein